MDYRHHHPKPCPASSSSASSFPCCCCCNHQTPPCHQPPASAPPDLLLQALVSHLLQNPQNHPHPQYPNHDPTTRSSADRCHHLNRPQHSKPKHPKQHPFAFPEAAAEAVFETHYPILQSLVERIDYLESTLRELSSPNGLRDVAARIIQTHFRAFLVRRSIALRQLKELAYLKSCLVSLKSSFSVHSHAHFVPISRKATDLLLRVDSIQGGDQMIRDSKRSITREIVQFLELVDGLRVDRRGHLVRNGNKTRVVSSSLLDNDKARPMKELRERVERIGRLSKALDNDSSENMEPEGFKHVIDEDGVVNEDGAGILRPKLKKHVSFLEDIIAAKGYSDDDDEIKLVQGAAENFDKRSVESDQEDEESERSSQASDHDHGGNPKRDHLTTRTYAENGKSNQNSNQAIVFHPPLPLKMESRADLMKKMKQQQQGVKDRQLN